MDQISVELQEFVDEAWKLKDSKDYEGWLRRLLAFVDSALGDQFAIPIADLGGTEIISNWREYRDRQASHLKGLVARWARFAPDDEGDGEKVVIATTRRPMSTTDVFLVHGHDTSARESAARFLEKLGLRVVILHEQASEGRTIIEKFEANTNVGFAVVLLTPDDVGAVASARGNLSGRARQNVILELGYFTGKLGRHRVCGLFKPDVEVPSDLHGVLFILMDESGGWRTKLAQELVSAGMQIDLQGLLHA